MAARITAATGGVILLSTLAALAAPGPVELATVRGALGQMSVPFVPNAGQWEREAAFAAHTFAGTLFVTTEGMLVYRLNGKPIADAAATGRPGTRDRAGERAAARQPGWVLTETLVDAAHNPLPATPAGAVPQKGKVSYAIGNDERRTVSANRTTKVGGDENLAVDAARSVKVANDDALTVGKALVIDAGDSVTIKSGSASLTLKSDGTVTINGREVTMSGASQVTVKSGGSVTVKGAKVMQN